ncbi:MAG: hypothetical protein KKF77_04080 [Proteobacteria bacterium]|nr:hypothetical protein [Pseudomonadota bacterium]
MHVETEPLARLFAHVEALRTTAEGLPDEQGGLALLLTLQAEDIEAIANRMDGEGWRPREMKQADAPN